jgi:dihydrofolate synthase/folylpolyglutamate synthase
MGYEDAIRYLYALQHHGIKLGLENPRRLLARLGSPQGGFKSIHIAGTNGKGSTAAMLHSMLRRAGHRTGLFTSPHLVSFTERIRVNGGEITPDEVVSLAGEVREAAGSAGLNPTFFEVVTAMGFLHFRRKGVEWAVVETGMGGRLDATNVLMPRATVITSISLDHSEFLGESIEDVAGEKAGIIKKGVPVVMAGQEGLWHEVIAKRAGELGSPLYSCGKDFDYKVTGHAPGRVSFDYSYEGLELAGLDVPLPGAYQAGNAALAVKAFQLVSGQHGPSAPFEAAVREGLSTLSWPGRLELIREKPPVFIDGAHNPAAAAALAETLKEDYLHGNEKLTLVIGVMADKDVRGILGPLLPLAGEAIFTAPEYGRAAAPEALAEYARDMGCANAGVAVPVAQALLRAMARGRTVLVTGSFYTAGAAREALTAPGFEIGLRE